MVDWVPFFMAWFVAWVSLFLYLWRLEAKIGVLEGEFERVSKGIEKD
ncbi:MAG: hypothetical protein HZRFUVUK_000648 [Candidatus Fervidibacterota bacterium]|jgi:hypothetical protein